MCGIIGILGKTEVAPRLLEGLRRLEYRGYDSAGLASLSNHHIERRRAEGKIANLKMVVENNPIQGSDGIGHTRWATHGAPIERNAHPHCTDELALVHNGIIENYGELYKDLKNKNITLDSDTDSEVVAHLISQKMREGLSPIQAVKAVLPKLKGAFALAMIFAGHHGLMIGARQGSPLAIGYGDGEMFLGSDALALAPFTNQVSYLEEGDWAVITHEKADIFGMDGRAVKRKQVKNSLTTEDLDMGNYRHFMEKEIHEQPGVVGDTIHALIDQHSQRPVLPPLPFDAKLLDRITASACGTAFYSLMVAKYWIEDLANLSLDIDIASELRYRRPPLKANGAALYVSQSGETMDSLEALRYTKRMGQSILSIVNVPESTIMRESNASLLTRAGPEIGVASTKAFTTQLAVLALLALELGKLRGHISPSGEEGFINTMTQIPRLMMEVISQWDEMKNAACLLAKSKAVFFMGRGNVYPIALEGALKLKEISYIHAEGYAAGEMKHGPIALIDKDLPVVMLAPSGPLLEKLAANVREITARDGKVILIGDKKATDYIHSHTKVYDTIIMPDIEPFFAPLLYSLPMQILAYETALLKGTDIDKPRNLAKSVTVE